MASWSEYFENFFRNSKQILHFYVCGLFQNQPIFWVNGTELKI